MGIESNKEAYQMVKNTLGSIENRFREAYNKGYKDGLRDGASQITAKLVGKILEETETDTPLTSGVVWTENDMPTPTSYSTSASTADTPQTDCYMCKWMGDRDVCGRCRSRNLFAVADTPQTDCAWK